MCIGQLWRWSMDWLCPCRHELNRIIKLLEEIKMDNEAVLVELQGLKDLAVKVKGEILTKLGELETQIAELQNVPQSIPDKIAEIRGVLGEMDAIVPDQP
jgi:hypothetical protein